MRRPIIALAGLTLLCAGLPAQAQWRSDDGRASARRFELRDERRGRDDEGGGWRRGQVVPTDRRGAYVADPGRYHLRAPPDGYGWVGDGRNAYLMQRSTGMVLDRVPGAYDRPPPDRRRR